MRVDESLLAQVVENPDFSFVRIYRWNEPTVSLGYFQPPTTSVDARLIGCPKVRRLTGGGAILHDREITYSCAVPASHPIRKNPLSLYETVHAAIVELLHDCGANASMRGLVENAERESSGEPFLCFLRSDPRDIVSNGQKIVGSAQRRRRGSILQHGSVLLEQSSLTPEIPGVAQLCDAFDEARFESQIGECIRSAISIS